MTTIGATRMNRGGVGRALKRCRCEKQPSPTSLSLPLTCLNATNPYHTPKQPLRGRPSSAPPLQVVPPRRRPFALISADAATTVDELQRSAVNGSLLI
ncbi:hypothetical protein Trydic_g21449 [Trypoxylus dichotomus]